jgi:hypothetical protein
MHSNTGIGTAERRVAGAAGSKNTQAVCIFLFANFGKLYIEI